jgi:hypothetical protein
MDEYLVCHWKNRTGTNDNTKQNIAYNELLQVVFSVQRV